MFARNERHAETWNTNIYDVYIANSILTYVNPIIFKKFSSAPGTVTVPYQPGLKILKLKH